MLHHWRTAEDAAAWEAWLAKQHAKSVGLWLRIAKAASNIQAVKRAETRAKKIEQSACWSGTR